MSPSLVETYFRDQALLGISSDLVMETREQAINTTGLSVNWKGDALDLRLRLVYRHFTAWCRDIGKPAVTVAAFLEQCREMGLEIISKGIRIEADAMGRRLGDTQPIVIRLPKLKPFRETLHVDDLIDKETQPLSLPAGRR